MTTPASLGSLTGDFLPSSSDSFLALAAPPFSLPRRHSSTAAGLSLLSRKEDRRVDENQEVDCSETQLPPETRNVGKQYHRVRRDADHADEAAHSAPFAWLMPRRRGIVRDLQLKKSAELR